MRDIPGKFVGILLAAVLTIIVPFVTVTVESAMVDRREIVIAVTNFIDEVVDSRVVTDAMLSELNTSISSHGLLMDYEIERYRRSVDPDPLKEGSFYTTYVKDSVNTNEYDKGDKISVHFYSVGNSVTENLAQRLCGIFIPTLDETITARIR